MPHSELRSCDVVRACPTTSQLRSSRDQRCAYPRACPRGIKTNAKSTTEWLYNRDTIVQPPRGCTATSSSTGMYQNKKECPQGIELFVTGAAVAMRRRRRPLTCKLWRPSGRRLYSLLSFIRRPIGRLFLFLHLTPGRLRRASATRATINSASCGRLYPF